MDVDIDELLSNRQNVLDASKDGNGYVQQQQVLEEVLPLLLEAQKVDSEDYNESYYSLESENTKINGYTVNDSGERLQIFLVDEDSVDETTDATKLLVSERIEHEKQFRRAIRFVKNSFTQKFEQSMQDSDPAKALAYLLSTSDGIEKFDAIEIFLISLRATVSFRGSQPQPRNIRFPEDKISVKYMNAGVQFKKDILVLREVVDLNFVYNAYASRGGRQPLTINFDKTFGFNLEVIKAAEGDKFSSYLGVFDGNTLAELYKRYSSRLLEKNVRSFLQFKGANRGLKDTIRTEPDRFIAYNNGLTITAVDAKIVERRRVLLIEELSDFQIVNGGQTIASIYFSRKEGLDVSKIKIMAKINVVENSESIDDLISNISKFSNTQSRVSNVDLRSRNPELVKLKSLSETIVTPQNNKWFFERAKGEYNTKLRIAGANAARVKREFPPERRFSKEQLAKYYVSWGETPYLVKKGGEKIFRHFVEYISDENSTQKVEVDRKFFENLVSLIVLFRRFEKIYGQGKNSMGQLRSAVIPYALSILFIYTDGSDRKLKFDLGLIWRRGALPEDFEEYSRSLLLMTNKLIKQYSESEDYGEYSKKEELWVSIRNSNEVARFMSTSMSEIILEKYCIHKE